MFASFSFKNFRGSNHSAVAQSNMDQLASLGLYSYFFCTLLKFLLLRLSNGLLYEFGL